MFLNSNLKERELKCRTEDDLLRLVSGPTAVSRPLDDLVLDICISVLVICFSTQIAEIQGRAMYQTNSREVAGTRRPSFHIPQIGKTVHLAYKRMDEFV